MKKVKFSGKLSLNKETVAKLNDEQMKNVNGGITTISRENYTCGTCVTAGNTCAATICRPSACGMCPE